MNAKSFLARSLVHAWIAFAAFIALYVALRSLMQDRFSSQSAGFFVPLFLAAGITVAMVAKFSDALWWRRGGRLDWLKQWRQNLRSLSPAQAYLVYGLGIYGIMIFAMPIVVAIEAGTDWKDSLWMNAVKAVIISSGMIAWQRWNPKHDPNESL